MNSLSEQHKAELQEIYALLNKNNTGIITIDDLNAVMQQLGRRATPAELQDMVRAVETDSNGAVDFDRFCRMMVRAEREEQLRESFERFDRDGDGVLSSDELYQALEDIMDEEPDQATVQQMMQEADPDGTGHISYANFIQMALKYQKN
ncbi:calmodulin-like [Drosophila ananassae]|uniref:calmodulin-like n=1 Tax=Drosophila ananassae TaxID=7217 RepID=UPI0013A5CE4B|nr:calmodulin-like [Drosophila ananassae]